MLILPLLLFEKRKKKYNVNVSVICATKDFLHSLIFTSLADIGHFFRDLGSIFLTFVT